MSSSKFISFNVSSCVDVKASVISVLAVEAKMTKQLAKSVSESDPAPAYGRVDILGWKRLIQLSASGDTCIIYFKPVLKCDKITQ